MKPKSGLNPFFWGYDGLRVSGSGYVIENPTYAEYYKKIGDAQKAAKILKGKVMTGCRDCWKAIVDIKKEEFPRQSLREWSARKD